MSEWTEGWAGCSKRRRDASDTFIISALEKLTFRDGSRSAMERFEPMLDRDRFGDVDVSVDAFLRG